MGEIRYFIESLQREIISPLITLIALAAFLYFLWGVVVFIQGAGDVEKRKVGQRHMLWGLVGLAILFGANAIIAFIAATVGA